MTTESERAELLALADIFDKATAVRLFDNGSRFFPDVGSQISEDARRLLVATLRLSAPEQTGEVVVYRWHHPSWAPFEWHYTQIKPVDPDPALKIEPLYTTPQPAPGFAEGFEANIKRELDDCQSAVATIEAHRDPTNETQNGNYRFYQGRVASLLFAVASLRAPAAPDGPKEVAADALVDDLIEAGLLFDDEHEAARKLLAAYTITPKVQS